MLRRLFPGHIYRYTCCNHYGTHAAVPKVAVVGAGPAGYYTTQQLLKATVIHLLNEVIKVISPQYEETRKGHPKVVVDMYEKLPVPFGLVRFGVAPDHPDVKNVINTFSQTSSQERCRFHGNVNVGRDITIDELRKVYTAVVLAYGADGDKMFGIPGETLPGVMSARAFVGWYNGLPSHTDLKPNLDTDTAVVLGQGNVAVDIVRILVTPVDVLKKTDITEYALEALSKSRIRQVYMVGRRGPLQAAFTTAEIRELVKLENARPIFNSADFSGFQNHINDIPRARKRMMELMMKTALETPVPNIAERWAKATKKWYLTFLRSPLEFISRKDQSRLGGVKFAVNRLEGPLGETQRAVPTGEEEILECGLAFRSIGYKSHQLDSSTPFDETAAVVPNSNGRVTGHPGLYCSGWVKRGPVGVLATTMTDAFETGKIIVDDFKTGALDEHRHVMGFDAVQTILKERGIVPVSFADWQKIDEYEKQVGAKRDKPREKMINVKEMLRIARQ